jgi:hypothetical protein
MWFLGIFLLKGGGMAALENQCAGILCPLGCAGNALDPVSRWPTWMGRL